MPNGCQIEAETVQRMLSAIEADSAIGAVCPAGEFYGLPKAGETELRRVDAAAAQYPFDQLVMLPKVALVSMNFLPDSYGQYFGDLELFHKLSEAGKRILVLGDMQLRRERAPQEMIDDEAAEAAYEATSARKRPPKARKAKKRPRRRRP